MPLLPLAAAAAALLASGASAATAAGPASAERARDGLVMWAAFKCVVYAENGGYEAERERLFTLGYERGRAFLAALEAEAIAEADLQRITPAPVVRSIGGPSHEFVIGRVFEVAQTDAAAKVVAAGQAKDVVLARAKALFAESNCALLGR